MLVPVSIMRARVCDSERGKVRMLHVRPQTRPEEAVVSLGTKTVEERKELESEMKKAQGVYVCGYRDIPSVFPFTMRA